jgi:tetratricopeptide (TPR) repeat protein/tRNA A-37 threonylcarbamoyl transferase component Bud32
MSADRNLLFGILAVQLDFVSKDGLISAMSAWLLDKSKSLGNILRGQGKLSAEELQHLDALVEVHLRRHGNDPQKSLAALSSVPPVLREQLAALPDDAVQQSVAHVASEKPLVPEPDPNQTIPQPPPEKVRYRILRPHARGGLGEVFVAEDNELGRNVALKEIQNQYAHDMVSRERFVREAEITGGLEHPGIVPVYGLGTYADGRPFYAMRFIKGDNLRQALQRFHGEPGALPARGFDSLNYRQLVQRFIDVCNAVAYAHSRGVLHRDLKPGNIMLGKYGETLVVDWGLAKPTGRSSQSDNAVDEATFMPRSGGDASSATVAGEALGTPAYMSPEQAAGRWDELGVASDIYSLGATLYELLTGRVPYPDFDLDAVQKGHFSPPRSVNPAVPRPLEAICLKAMTLKPLERYTAALDIAKDLERWLADEPVRVWKEPAGVRVRRWVRKHSRLVTGVVAALLVASAGFAMLAAERERARLAVAREQGQTARERDEKAAALEVSQKRLAQVESGIDILASVFTNLDPRQEEKESKPLRYLLSQQLERATEQLTGETVGEPLAVARLQLKLGWAQRNLGAATQAVRLFTAARATFSAQLGPDHPDTLASMGSLAEGYYAAGQLDKALPLYEETLKLLRAKLGPDHPDTLIGMNNLGQGYQAAGQLDKALPLFEETLKLMRAKLGPDHFETLTSMNNLGDCYRAAGRLDKALPLFEETVKVKRAKLGPDHPDTLTSMVNLALGYQHAGQLDKALPLFEETLKLMRAKLGPDHPDTLASMNGLAAGYYAAGQLDKALPLYEETLKLLRAKLGPDHPYTLNSMNNLAAGYYAAGRLDKALPLFEETVKLNRAKLGPDHPDTLTSMNNLAVVYKDAGQIDKALPLYEETLKLRRAKFGPDHPDTLQSMNNLAVVYKDAGQLDKALPLFEETLKLSRAKLGRDHPDTLTSMSSLAAGYYAAGRLDKALPLYEETLKLRRAKSGPDHPDTLTSMSGLAMAYRAAGQLGKALVLFEETLKLRRAKLGPDHPDTLTSMNNLAVVYKDAGQLDKALPLFEETLMLRRAKVGPDHPDTLASMNKLAGVFLDAKQPSKALPLFHEFLAGWKKRLREDLRFAGYQASVGADLIKASEFAAAEPILRECLTIREKHEPDAWTTFNARSLVGSSLFGQKKYTEAEPLLLAGYEGMKQRQDRIPKASQGLLTDALNRLVQLYDATGPKEKADALRAKLSDLRWEIADAPASAVHP